MSNTHGANDALIEQIRTASRCMVRELGFMRNTLAATDYAPSAVHALLEIGARKAMTAAQLADFLGLEKSSISRMVRKLIEAGELNEKLSADDGRSKYLRLTPRGKRTLSAIDAFGRAQVSRALAQLTADQQLAAAEGLQSYAQALQAHRQGQPLELSQIDVVSAYQPGAIGRIVQMHADFYSRSAGLGSFFESKVAAGLAEFIARAPHARNGLWLALQNRRIVGSIAIDGQDLGENRAHLRWFIVDDGLRGGGAGRRLLEAALAFCDAQGFDAVHLWTFQGLDAARRLYEAYDFTLLEQWLGSQWGKELIEQRFVR